MRALAAPVLLLVLAEKPAHGYELAKRLSEMHLGFRGSGSVYGELRKLERAGLVRSFWETDSGGPGRKIYELTPPGVETLDESAVALTDLVERLRSYIPRFERLTSHPQSTPAEGRSAEPTTFGPR